MALQKAFHAGNDGDVNEADQGDAHGRHQGIDVDCTTLKNTVRRVSDQLLHLLSTKRSKVRRAM